MQLTLFTSSIITPYAVVVVATPPPSSSLLPLLGLDGRKGSFIGTMESFMDEETRELMQR